MFLILTVSNNSIIFTLVIHKASSTTSGSNSKSNTKAMPREQVGDFYVHLVRGPTATDARLISSTKLLSSTGKPTVIHFYDGGWGGCRPCAAQMEAWARKMPQVQFLCVCVESKEVAIAFHCMFRFEHMVNGYIPSRGYMPVGYGQLGCSGFIVSNKDGYFVSKKTSA